MDANKTVGDYGIVAGSSIQVIDVDNNQILLTIEIPGGTIYLVEQVSTAPKSVINDIRDKLGWPRTQEFSLYFGCQELFATTFPLSRYGITQNSVLLVNPPGITIYVKYSPTETLTIEVPYNGTIADVKTEIQNLKGVAPEQQILSLTGQELTDSDNVCQYANQTLDFSKIFKCVKRA